MTNYRTIVLTLIFSLLLALFSCTKDSAPPTFGDYPTEIGKIFTYKCATSGCHNTESAPGAANLDLSSYSSLFKGSTNGSPVIPFRSDFSSLCYFINTYSDLGPQSLPTMPLYKNPLSKNEVQTIKSWIDAGAPDINGNIKWSDNPNRRKYYVINQGCDVVTVFDADTQLPMRYVDVGNTPGVIESPHVIKVAPNGLYWYVIYTADSILQKFRTSDDAFVGEVKLGPYDSWNTMTITSDSKTAYCVSWQASSRLAVVDLETMTLKYNVGGGNYIDSHGIALNKTEDTLYLTKQHGNYIYKIDKDFNTGFQEITIDGSGTPNGTTGLIDPHQIVFSPDGSKYFITCQASNEIRVMSTVGDVLIQTIPTGTYPQEMIMHAETGKLYITCADDMSGGANIRGSVTVVDINSFAYQNYPVGYQLHGIDLDKKNDLLIVPSRNLGGTGIPPHHSGVCGKNGFVNYFKLSTMQLLPKKTELSSDPYSVSVRH